MNKYVMRGKKDRKTEQYVRHGERQNSRLMVVIGEREGSGPHVVIVHGMTHNSLEIMQTQMQTQPLNLPPNCSILLTLGNDGA